MKNKFVATCFLVMAFFACKKDKIEEGGEAPKLTKILSISPVSVQSGDTLLITGVNLSAVGEVLSVMLNGNKAPIVSAGYDSIKVIVAEMSGSGIVELVKKEQVFKGPSYTYNYQVLVNTVAGNGTVGRNDGVTTNASFYCPWGITVGMNNELFVADCYNRLIRKVSLSTDMVSSYQIPVSLNGKYFFSPYNITIDDSSQTIFATDFNTNLMRMSIDGSADVIYTGEMPLTGIAVDPAKKKIYVGNNNKGTITMLNIDGSNPELVASGLSTPRNIFFNNKGEMFVSANSGPIYKIEAGKALPMGSISTHFKGWEAVADNFGNFILADHQNNRVGILEKSGKYQVIAGSGQAADIDGKGLNAAFDGPQGIAIDKKNGHIYITTYNYERKTGNKIRRLVIK